MSVLGPNLRHIAGIVIVVVTMTALAGRLLPIKWRPSGISSRVVAVIAAYVVIRIGSETEFLYWLNSDVFTEKIGGEFDEMATWFVAGGAALIAVVAVRLVRRLLMRGMHRV